MTKLKEYKMYINGSWVDAEGKKTFKSLNPENNEPWAVVPEASAKDVNKAVDAAQKAFEGKWPKLMPKERANYLRAIANQLRENSEMLGKIKVNTLITTGENDIGSTPDMSKNLSRMIPGSKFVEIKDGKHLCGIECANNVNIIFKEFIDKNND